MHHVLIFHILLLHAKGGAQCSGLQGLQVKACLDLRGDTNPFRVSGLKDSAKSNTPCCCGDPL